MCVGVWVLMGVFVVCVSGRQVGHFLALHDFAGKDRSSQFSLLMMLFWGELGRGPGHPCVCGACTSSRHPGVLWLCQLHTTCLPVWTDLTDLTG